MYWYFTTFSLLLLFSAATSIIIALYAWKRRPVSGSVAFAIAMLAITQWSLSFLLHVISTDAAAKLAWFKFQYVGIVILPIAWLAFTLQYTGRGARLTSRNLLFLAVVPLISFTLVLTNDALGLFWQNVQLDVVSGLPVIVFAPTMWYWLSQAFLYGCYLAGSLFIVTSRRYEIASLYPGQAFFLVMGLLLPWFGLALHYSGLNIFNLMPLAFAVSGIVVARYALHFRFLKKTLLERHVVINSLDDGVLVLDRAMKVVDANSAAGQILARPLSDLLQRPLTAVWPDLAAQLDAIAARPRDMVRIHDGRVRYYEAHLSQLVDWRKLPSAHLLTLHDITDRKQAETLREDMTHSMVHDLRSPISNSLFALQMLKGNLEQDAASPDNHHLLDITFANTEKVLHLVNNILDVGRLESGQIPLNRTAVPLDGLIRRVIKGHMAHAAEKQILIQYDIPTDLPPAWADSDLLERVLQNLLDNSLKFSAQGGTISLTAVSLTSDDGNARLEVSISDDGPGLPPELTHTVFDKFVTGPNKESGNGLGLAFCQMALAAHGERIWATNNQEQGVTFTFSLPVVPSAYQGAKSLTAVSSDATTPFPGNFFAHPSREMATLSR